MVYSYTKEVVQERKGLYVMEDSRLSITFMLTLVVS